MRDQLRAGIAIYNDAFYHAAHDVWEPTWLDLETETDDEQLLHGLIQTSAAVHHAHSHNWEGAVGLAERAHDYLRELPPTYRNIELQPVRSFLTSLAADPELVERRRPVRIEHDGTVPSLVTLDLDSTLIAAPVLAEAMGYETAPIERAREYAESDLEAGADDSRFIALLFDFVREDDARGIVYQRLTSHVERRQTRESDVEGLF
ncbi:DUF309 domain-containing protein [Natrialba asiatica]|uniref:DUF309 domain-containing protein n=1 Tax=Natrialba asiatica (strain ATCC 700177 / DSM 12278 / JCM 9576 / FERM P-10747 / NBRC 102637 / 172P1) TaxID=29540 RepID=M0AJV8_NATA1|nr:DUF309 domain-containing protein [Natrialba asiatica]ELY98651.1 hypothetical protein C481_17042 [Natrialba asiatica DSM 12278]